MNQIVIQQSYFDNIKVAVDAINQFFESGFQQKNFPTDTANLEYSITNILDILNDLDPIYIKDSSSLEHVTDDIIEKISNMPDKQNALMNQPISNALDSIVAYIALQVISENFELFSQLINGIYTVDIFLHPSKYQEALELFTENLPIPTELEDIGLNVALFSIPDYVDNFMGGNTFVHVPTDMDPEEETQRMLDFQDAQDVEIVISKSTEITEYAYEVFQPYHIHRTGDVPMRTSEVKEAIHQYFNSIDEVTLDTIQTEQFQSLVYDELSTIPDQIYNQKLSPNKLAQFVQEAGRFVPYKKKGDIPDYMKGRMQIPDEIETGGSDDSASPDKPVEIPDPVIPPPSNSINDLADSVDAKMGMDGDMESIMGQGFNSNPEKNTPHIVYNITNTYNNSFNRDSHNTVSDLSSGKTITTKTSAGRDAINSRSNNYSNSSDSLDTKDFEKELPSNGRRFNKNMSVQEMFAFLESEEPLSSESSTRKGYTADSLTDTVKRSKKSVPEETAERKDVQRKKAEHKGPVKRVKQWLTDTVNSLIQRDEDQVKSEIIENPGYRMGLYKAGRAAIKLGLVGVAFTISGWIGAATVGVMALRHADRVRLRREVSEEFMTEIKILDEKMDYIKSNPKYNNDPAKRKELYQMMRLRNQMVGIVADTQRNRWRQPQSYNTQRR